MFLPNTRCGNRQTGAGHWLGLPWGRVCAVARPSEGTALLWGDLRCWLSPGEGAQLVFLGAQREGLWSRGHLGLGGRVLRERPGPGCGVGFVLSPSEGGTGPCLDRLRGQRCGCRVGLRVGSAAEAPGVCRREDGREGLRFSKSQCCGPNGDPSEALSVCYPLTLL